MKYLFILLLIFHVSFTGHSQVNLLRYNDDFRYLKTDSTRKKGTDKLKYLRLGKNSFISFGGEVREQFQYYRNINFGDLPPSFPKTTSWQLWQRLMLHTNIELGTHSRVFVQLGSTHRFINPNPLTPEIEQNDLNLHQAFVDYKNGEKWMVRLGRQELSYGSHRLITFREGPNTRLPFDGLVVRYRLGKRKLDLFTLSSVISQKGIFDDQSFKDLVAGIYITEILVPKWLSIDYYFLNYSGKRRQYNYISGKENRQIIGTRLFSQNREMNYELEVTYQFGKFNDLHISAYSLSADLNRKCLARNVTIGLAGNYVSGDHDPHDNLLNTYNLLFSKPQYGLTAPIGATNMVTINPYLKLNPIKAFNLYSGLSLLWRQSDHDGTYSPGAIEVRPAPQLLFDSGKKRIGSLLTIETNYVLTGQVSFAIDGSYFFAEDYLKASGKGKNISYISFKANYKF